MHARCRQCDASIEQSFRDVYLNNSSQPQAQPTEALLLCCWHLKVLLQGSNSSLPGRLALLLVLPLGFTLVCHHSCSQLLPRLLKQQLVLLLSGLVLLGSA